MYAVIFRAQTGKQDQAYADTVARMRQLAFEKYACLEFVALTEGDQEIAISYWRCEADILAWKQDPEHALAQQQGRDQWYRGYSVEVVELKRRYQFPAE
ncbi:antibiotic biosynthesis monooxygenase family protein [Neptuniibacter halophilus]|uniref:antibiotic biosynthesis monooxygenase family protein n=1 Tax=Neptuniibacter halophilus TaxID=651666 RepID=UPI002573F511|nr:antibiotic biosynthesis monooxygenase [Neptuniibacter halophilus]